MEKERLKKDSFKEEEEGEGNVIFFFLALILLLKPMIDKLIV